MLIAFECRWAEVTTKTLILHLSMGAESASIASGFPAFLITCSIRGPNTSIPGCYYRPSTNPLRSDCLVLVDWNGRYETPAGKASALSGK